MENHPGLARFVELPHLGRRQCLVVYDKVVDCAGTAAEHTVHEVVLVPIVAPVVIAQRRRGRDIAYLRVVKVDLQRP